MNQHTHSFTQSHMHAHFETTNVSIAPSNSNNNKSNDKIHSIDLNTEFFTTKNAASIYWLSFQSKQMSERYVYTERK